MYFDSKLIPGKLIKRYKRFLTKIQLNNKFVTAHCPNPGSMLGISKPGSGVFISKASNKKRKLKYTLELIDLGNGNLVGVNTLKANRIIEEALNQKKIQELKHFHDIKREVPCGGDSRIDFLLAKKDTECFLEVKSVTLRRNTEEKEGIAEFPDSVTARGSKHLNTLSKIVKRGGNAIVLYLIQRSDCKKFKIAEDIDPDYMKAMKSAISAGVKILCYCCKISPNGIHLDKKIKFSTVKK